MQTHRNFSWRYHGLRVDIWRMFDMLKALALPATQKFTRLTDEFRQSLRCQGRLTVFPLLQRSCRIYS
jgi:hypothetical protein